jgi:hypothetical protein
LAAILLAVAEVAGFLLAGWAAAAAGTFARLPVAATGDDVPPVRWLFGIITPFLVYQSGGERHSASR